MLRCKCEYIAHWYRNHKTNTVGLYHYNRIIIKVNARWMSLFIFSWYDPCPLFCEIKTVLNEFMRNQVHKIRSCPLFLKKRLRTYLYISHCVVSLWLIKSIMFVQTTNYSTYISVKCSEIMKILKNNIDVDRRIHFLLMYYV